MNLFTETSWTACVENGHNGHDIHRARTRKEALRILANARRLQPNKKSWLCRNGVEVPAAEVEALLAK